MSAQPVVDNWLNEKKFERFLESMESVDQARSMLNPEDEQPMNHLFLPKCATGKCLDACRNEFSVAIDKAASVFEQALLEFVKQRVFVELRLCLSIQKTSAAAVMQVS